MMLANPKVLPLLPVLLGPMVMRHSVLMVLSFLSLERRVVDPAVAWAQAYTTGGPRTGVTTCYYWDNAYQATLLSLLDPASIAAGAIRRFTVGAPNGRNGTMKLLYSPVESCNRSPPVLAISTSLTKRLAA